MHVKLEEGILRVAGYELLPTITSSWFWGTDEEEGATACLLLGCVSSHMSLWGRFLSSICAFLCAIETTEDSVSGREVIVSFMDTASRG